MFINLQINGITRVFYGKDYISVGKQELIDWSDIKPQIIDIVCDNFSKDIDLFIDKPESDVK